MKRMCTAAFLALWLALTGGAAAQEASYADGIYRGFYYDGGIEQIAIQFELQDGVFQSVVYRGVKYKDGDYMSDDASDAQKAALRQYRELAAYLVGKGVDAIDDLYAPYGIVEDIDAVTTATMQSSKLISALWDGLNRRPFKLLSTAKLPAADDFADGVYRGSYMEDGEEEVAVEFTLENNVFSDVRYRALSYHGVDYLSPDAPEDAKRVAGQFEALLAHLQGSRGRRQRPLPARRHRAGRRRLQRRHPARAQGDLRHLGRAQPPRLACGMTRFSAILGR